MLSQVAGRPPKAVEQVPSEHIEGTAMKKAIKKAVRRSIKRTGAGRALEKAMYEEVMRQFKAR